MRNSLYQYARGSEYQQLPMGIRVNSSLESIRTSLAKTPYTQKHHRGIFQMEEPILDQGYTREVLEQSTLESSGPNLTNIGLKLSNSFVFVLLPEGSSPGAFHHYWLILFFLLLFACVVYLCPFCLYLYFCYFHTCVMKQQPLFDRLNIIAQEDVIVDLRPQEYDPLMFAREVNYLMIHTFAGGESCARFLVLRALTIIDYCHRKGLIAFNCNPKCFFPSDCVVA